MTTVAFTIQIGDWSGDGHGHCEEFRFVANKPIEDVREAYFVAKKKHPKICPERFCDEYEVGTIPDEIHAALTAAGAPVRDEDDLEQEGITAGEMAGFVAWFCMQGDPDLVVKADPLPPVPYLAFYGADEKGRHIGFHGYGLFGS
jgi:hypothetical protein